jgi:hypothetical protein
VVENARDHQRRGDDMNNENETGEPSGASGGSRGSFWLITVAQDDCRGFSTVPIAQHPADYISKNAGDSLICAIPISRKQFLVAKRAYENG